MRKGGIRLHYPDDTKEYGVDGFLSNMWSKFVNNHLIIRDEGTSTSYVFHFHRVNHSIYPACKSFSRDVIYVSERYENIRHCAHVHSPVMSYGDLIHYITKRLYPPVCSSRELELDAPGPRSECMSYLSQVRHKAEVSPPLSPSMPPLESSDEEEYTIADLIADIEKKEQETEDYLAGGEETNQVGQEPTEPPAKKRKRRRRRRGKSSRQSEFQ